MSRGSGPGLSLQLRTGVVLAPVLRQGMRLLRMGQNDLTEEIRKELARNPFLRCTMPRRSVSTAETPIELMAAPSASLFESLRDQIGQMKLAPSVRRLALALVADMGPDGYLDQAVVDQLEAGGVGPDEVAQALDAVQHCDPPGVGARSLAECLELQLRDMGLAAADAARTVAALPLLARGDDAAAAQMGTDPDETALRMQLVRRLRAHPVASDIPHRVDAPPDIEVTMRPTKASQIASVRETGPQLLLDSALVARSRSEGFALDQIARAEALIMAIQFRKDTLTRIAEALVEFQHRFFTDGPLELRPLTQASLAGELGLHPSTISRAIAGKTMAVNGQVWALSALFSIALPASGGGALSASVVRQRIARLIATEPPLRPLSDAAIAQVLQGEGVDIARRTVAKYREMLRLPGSSNRRARASAASRAVDRKKKVSNRGKGIGKFPNPLTTKHEGEAHAVPDQRQAD